MTRESQLYKPCKKCGVTLRCASTKCPSCGALYPRKVKKKTPAPAADPDPDFVAGIAIDGSVMLFWPNAEEKLLIKPEEVEIIRRVLDLTRKVSAE